MFLSHAVAQLPRSLGGDRDTICVKGLRWSITREHRYSKAAAWKRKLDYLAGTQANQLTREGASRLRRRPMTNCAKLVTAGRIVRVPRSARRRPTQTAQDNGVGADVSMGGHDKEGSRGSARP